MAVIGGCILVLIAVLVGFTMAGGSIGSLIHPSEFVTIGGAAFGALLVMTPKKVLKDLIRGLMQSLKGTPYNKQAYSELFKLYYAIAKLVRQEGLVSLDSHISNPDDSTLFKAHPKIDKDHHIRNFICTALSLVVNDKADAAQITEALESEIKVIEREHHAAVAALSKTADALPGFGIVAAVLGIVVTMQAIGGPAEEIGHKVGAALVGTFLGILLSYGFFSPLAGRMDFMGEAESIFLRTITAATVALGEQANPRDVVTRANRVVATDCRPNPNEMKQIFGETATA